GALLLHRLPQPPSGLPEGVPRPPRQLGLCRRDARQGGLIASYRHCEERQRRSNPNVATGEMDCFASLAMTKIPGAVAEAAAPFACPPLARAASLRQNGFRR